MKAVESEAFWYVLASADPGFRGKTDLSRLAGDKRLLQAALDLATANGLAYRFLRGLAEASRALAERVGPLWKDELAAADRYRATIGALNYAGLRTGIGFAVIKNVSAVDHVPRDVDIFLPAEDREVYLAALEDQGLRTAYRDEAEISMAAPGLLRVDVYSRIHYLGRDFVDELTLRRARSKSANLGVSHPTLSPDATFLVNSAHGLFGHSAMTLLDFVDFAALQRRTNGSNGARSVAAAHGWGAVLDRWCDRLAALRRSVYDDGTPVAFPSRHGRRFILECAATMGRPVNPRDESALRMSLLWDDLLYVSEHTGIDEVIRGSKTLTGIANAAGHRLRVLRGDRKGLYADAEKRHWERAGLPGGSRKT